MGNSSYAPREGVFDGFAGPGVYDDGEPGSPVLVLEALLEHQHFSRWATTEFVFLFNEQDPARCASLEKVIEDLPARWSPCRKSVTVMPYKNRAFGRAGRRVARRVKNS